MISTNQHFMYSPGGENEVGGNIPKQNQDEKENVENISDNNEKEKNTIVDKIKDALQDWSNDDKADEDFDNTQV